MRKLVALSVSLFFSIGLCAKAGAVVSVNEEGNFANKMKSPFTFEIDESGSFDFEIPTENGENEEGFNYERRIRAGDCSGWIDGPKLKSDGEIYYGISVSCRGTGFLPLYAEATLQEEWAWFRYYDVASTGREPLTSGGMGYVGSTIACPRSDSDTDFRVQVKIWAGDHHGFGFSKEKPLPCNF